MKTTVLITLIALLPSICYSQTSTTKYFKDQYLQKEVSEEKAKFSKTVTQHEDESVTTEIKDLTKNVVIDSHTFKVEEPVGVWIESRGDNIYELDYDFQLVYADPVCEDSVPGVVNYFKDNAAFKYVAPKLSSGDTSLIRFISRNTVYPRRAMEMDISGTVELLFWISPEGVVENISIRDASHILLDKEAMRVLKTVKFLNGPTLNGVPKSICMVMPIKFLLN